ncbi:hypothetical protein OHA25_06900 [Nonomuraea sp. NBC_00507]|uniref:hypothetical protein n=1 Tax=Nonomuraea sp. NBC_00507 TaxID=2976002 RepID=UPI002E196C0D
MGTDWVPALVRDGTDPAELQQVARTHATLSHALRTQGRNDDALRMWREVDERLRGLLVLDTDADGGWPSHRVAVIGDNPLFPPEWRRAAWSTLLPDRLAAWSARWRHWYDAVMDGQFRHYLHRLRTWEASRELAHFQTELIAAARATEGRTNAWTRKPVFLEARQRRL